MAIDIESPGADRAALKAALQELVGFGPIDLNGASMVHFPNTAWLKRDTAPTGVADGRKGTCSFLYNDCGWADAPTVALDIVGNASVFDIATGFGCGMAITITPNEAMTRLNVYLNDGAGGKIQRGPIALLVTVMMPNWQPGLPNHVLITWDFTDTPGLMGVTVNGLALPIPSYVNTPSAIGDFNYTGDTDPDTPGFFGTGSVTNGGGADYGNVFMDFVNALTITKGRIATADAEKFFKDGQVQSLGSDGSTPFGAAPAIYFTGNAAGYATNRGDGGAFTLTGTISDA